MCGEGAHVGVRVFGFEYSMRDFFEPQNIVEQCWFLAFLLNSARFLSNQNPAMDTKGKSALDQGSDVTEVKSRVYRKKLHSS
jgi:hypothetical protein